MRYHPGRALSHPADSSTETVGALGVGFGTVAVPVTFDGVSAFRFSSSLCFAGVVFVFFFFFSSFFPSFFLPV